MTYRQDVPVVQWIEYRIPVHKRKFSTLLQKLKTGERVRQTQKQRKLL